MHPWLGDMPPQSVASPVAGATWRLTRRRQSLGAWLTMPQPELPMTTLPLFSLLDAPVHHD